MWGTDRGGQCPLGHSIHHCNNFIQWSPPKPLSKACLRFGLSIEVRLFSLFKCFVPFNVQKKTWYSFTILLLSHSKLMWTDKLLSVSCFSISFRTGVEVSNVSWMSELCIPLLYNAEATEVVYEVRILGTFRKSIHFPYNARWWPVTVSYRIFPLAFWQSTVFLESQ
jgi:hypothetical protein